MAKCGTNPKITGNGASAGYNTGDSPKKVLAAVNLAYTNASKAAEAAFKQFECPPNCSLKLRKSVTIEDPVNGPIGPDKTKRHVYYPWSLQVICVDLKIFTTREF